PRTAPPVYGDVGSTATTPTFLSRPRRLRTRRLMRELLPTPGGPVNPTTWARPVCGWIRATASVASGSSSSIRAMSFPAARLSPFRRESTRPGTGSRGRAAGPCRAGTRSRPFARGLEEGDDFPERRPGAEHDLDAGLLELGNVFLRNDPAARDEDVARLPFLEELHHLREKGHVRPAEARQADRVDVLLDRGLDDVLRTLPQAGVDDLHAGVAQRAGDDLGPAVVAVESRFRNQDADLLRDRTTSIQERFLVSAEDLAHHVADLAERRLRPDRVEEERHRVVVRFARLQEAVESGGVLLRVPRSANLAEPGRLGFERRLRDPQDLEIRLFVHDEIVDADDHPLAVLDLPLVSVCGVRNLLLEEPFPDRGVDAAEPLDPVEVPVGLFLEFVREGLEEIGAAEGVDRIRDAALVGQDLLRPEGEARGRFVRDLIRFVVRVRMKGLSSPEDGGEGLDRRPDEVDLRLLGGQADAGGLRVEPEEPRP